MDIILLPGLWLDQSAWADVLPELATRGHRAVAPALPGQRLSDASAQLDQQRQAVLDAVDASADRCVVVGHSAAATLAWLAADASPQKVGHVVLIGGFPVADGEAYADFFEPVDGVMRFPGWAVFDGPDSADLDEDARIEIETNAIPVPVGVSRGIVRYADEARFDVPVTLICPEFSPAQAKEWVASEALPELASARQLEYVDIDSGHWPMFTKPRELAKLIATAAG